MNKLEKAISLSLNNGDFGNNEFSGLDSSKSMEEIAKMAASKKLTIDELNVLKIVHPTSEQEKLINQLRDIRTAINKRQGKNLVMVTSVDDASGVSFFCKNIAAVTAFDAAKSSMIIDCNFESHGTRDTFHLTNTPGIVDYILDKELDEKQIIHDSGINRLRVIHSGNDDSRSGEFFMHPRFRKLLFSLKNRYTDRTLFIDAPPLLNSADARILSELCDMVILVLPNGKVNKKHLEVVSNSLPKDKLLGAVINNYIF